MRGAWPSSMQPQTPNRIEHRLLCPGYAAPFFEGCKRFICLCKEGAPDTAQCENGCLDLMATIEDVLLLASNQQLRPSRWSHHPPLKCTLIPPASPASAARKKQGRQLTRDPGVFGNPPGINQCAEAHPFFIVR